MDKRFIYQVNLILNNKEHKEDPVQIAQHGCHE